VQQRTLSHLLGSRVGAVLRLALSCAAVLLIFAVARSALAQTMYPPVTDRNFSIDLFEQPALGSPRLIAMAGAIDSVAEGAAGLFTNPGSAAVRPETKSNKFAWNVYLNSYIPAKGQDSDNNGQAVTDVRRALLGAAGLLLQYGQWGLSLDAGYTTHEISPAAGGGVGVRSLIGHITLARTFLDQSLAVGLSARIGALNVFTLDGNNTLFTRGGASAEAGAVWKPREQDFRVALSAGLPVLTGALSYKCDPTNCYGYILPSDAIVPWESTLGGAWRFGPTYWNHEVDGEYRDERSLTIALELSVIGAVSNGYGMEAFAAKQLQASGRELSATPRLGLESEVIPGWLRLRAGTYDEASRFEGVSRRWHGTGGAEVRIFSFHLGQQERRVSVSFAADAAARYHNLGLSAGFWN
jgi:hypothetical protein